MTMEEMGERGWIEELRGLFGQGGGRTLVGIGDDAAVVEARGRPLVLTTDAFAEWVHFRFDQIAPDQVGEKVVAATVSDCAAMGCAPLWLTVCIALPAETPASRVRSIYAGIRRGTEKYACDLVGGDTISAVSDLVLALHAVGEPLGARLFTRAGAEVGDDLFVTGRLGGATAGRLLLENAPDRSLQEEFRPSVLRYLAPEARVREAEILARGFPVTSMIDVSDGLSVELHHLAREGGRELLVEEGTLPAEPSALRIAEELGVPPEPFVLHGGEEFELLFTLPPGEEDRLIDEIRAETGREVTRIGTVSEGEGVLLVDETGEGEPLPEGGYEHFRERSSGGGTE